MVFALYRKKGYLYRLPFTADFFFYRLPFTAANGEQGFACWALSRLFLKILTE